VCAACSVENPAIRKKKSRNSTFGVLVGKELLRLQHWGDTGIGAIKNLKPQKKKRSVIF